MKLEKYIKESSLSRIWKLIEDDKYSFAVISAFHPNDPDNEKNHKLLKADIRNAGTGFVELKSQWKYPDGKVEKEKSLLTANIDKQDALHLAKKYDQVSILWKDEKQFIEMSQNGKTLTSFKKASGKQDFSLKVSDLFSVLKKGSHRTKKFVFNVKENSNMNYSHALGLEAKGLPIQEWNEVLEDGTIKWEED